jgi:6-pyruvoyltetrahydropterin/6-carboxytetrahydropterin synthase
LPTTENLAALIFQWLAPHITRGALHCVRLYETSDLFVDCYGDAE